MEVKRNSRKGVTILEMIIALTVITIISGIALSMAMTAVEVENKSQAGIEMTSRIESIVECFQFSDTQEMFEELIKKLEKSEDAFEAGTSDNDNISKVLVLDKGNYKIAIKIYNDFKKIEINANLKGDDNKTYTYYKG